VRLALRPGWVFSPATDVAVFAGPVLVSAALVAAFAASGRLHDEVPPWAFAVLVIGCDVAHVWSTLFRTYLDPEERRRSGALLAGVPLACFVAGATLHAIDPSGVLFWRTLAYLAAFHFVRQQVGWMAYSARRAGETSAFDRRLDRLAVYNATVFPLLWWHANLPRAFDWFVPGDFVAGVPAWAAVAGHALHWTVNAAWIARQAWLLLTGRGFNPAKALVLASTWAAWYGGIVLLDSDIAFTATNVLAHGVPYFVIVHRWGRSRWSGESGHVARLFRQGAWPLFYAPLVLLAFAEEGLWDRLVWHDHASLFPLPSLRPDGPALAVAVALLATPQATHYVLDAFLWRTGRANPDLARRLGFGESAATRASRL
jgi:hypothetical protein